MDQSRPEFPLNELHAAADDDATRASVDALHAELAKERPSTEAIVAHVDRLRERPTMLTAITNWFDDPRVQTFLADLSSAGL